MQAIIRAGIIDSLECTPEEYCANVLAGKETAPVGFLFGAATAAAGIKMLIELKESYEKIASQDTSSPVMENTQMVYAGLTYGKNSLNIDLSDQGIDRGFRI